MSPAQHPRARIRTRVTLAFFLLSAIPAVLVSGAAVVLIDELIKGEIQRRTEEVAASTKLMIEGETGKAREAVDAFAKSDDLRRIVLEPLAHGDTPVPEEMEALLDRGAKNGGLDLLALVDATRGTSSILASAHSPASIEYPAPKFAARAAAGTSTVGFAHELIAGNPPVWAPALIAVRGVGLDERFDKGGASLVVYGGFRLDTHRLQAIATNGHARLVLESPRLRSIAFPTDAGAEETAGAGPAIALPLLANGRAKPAWATANALETEEPKEPTRILVHVDTTRLERARTTFATAAAALVALWLLLAPIAGALLSRPITGPIVELASAAQEIGAGNLDVKIEPRTDDEVGALVAVFNQMTAELAESRVRLQRAERIAAWREIARRVAHEIKNPLFPIQMSVETLRKSFKNKHAQLEEIVEESTKTVLEEVRALNRIVTEFSDFARLPAPKLEPLSIAEVLEHVAALYAEGRVASGIRVELDRATLAARGLPAVSIDREQISRALINLVKNAVEAMPAEGGTVTLDAELEARSRREGVRISVRDTGSGIPADILSKIFTPYFTTKTSGTGLGLAIVERIVQEHQGAIDVDSQPGKGTAFHLWLPAA